MIRYKVTDSKGKNCHDDRGLRILPLIRLVSMTVAELDKVIELKPGCNTVELQTGYTVTRIQ